jgi:hypothetical protein
MVSSVFVVVILTAWVFAIVPCAVLSIASRAVAAVRQFVSGVRKKQPEVAVQPPARRRVVQAMVLRFYRSDGWTREEVRQLLREDKRLARVLPRYFDERDKVPANYELDDGLPHDECEYFAVYDVSEPFSEEALDIYDLV